MRNENVGCPDVLYAEATGRAISEVGTKLRLV